MTATIPQTEAGAAPEPEAQALEARLGYRFRDHRLRREALIHASASGRGRRAQRSNERLEFLGDRVLGLVVARLLFERFPGEREGELTRRHAQLVRRETLAEVAATLDLGRWLTVARSEEDGDRRKPALLADALEAVIGAIYLDGGLPPAQCFVERLWQARLEAMPAAPRDAKTALQEWAQGRGLERPRYRVVSVEGPDHAPRFEVAVAVEDLPAESAAAPSKRAAEQAAAQALLARLEASGAADG